MNPLRQANGNMPFGNPQALKQQFDQWRSTMSGDPQAILQQMMQSGRVNQQMVNKAQMMAQMFGQFLR